MNDKSEVLNSISSFISEKLSAQEKVVLVSSGGTSVPLEKNTVRSLENFSTGTRGALSTEEFLYHGYNVIYLYRKGTKMPFIVHFNLEDFFNCPSDPKFEKFKKLSENYKSKILYVPYVTMDDYLVLYESISKELSPLGSKSMIFLSAAVSDFIVAPEHLETNKIQTNSKGLTLHLDPAKKEIYKIKEEWATKAFLVTFKLETDKNLLFTKAKNAIKKTKSDYVVANLLQTRYDTVYLIGENEETTINKVSEFIEKDLVNAITKKHEEYIKKN